MLPIVNEELFWGDAGIGMSIMGTTLAVAAIFSAGTPRAVRRVGAAVLRHASTTRRSARSASPSPTRAATCPPCAPAPATTRPTDEWVLNGQKAWATNGGIANVHVVIASVDPELGARGQAGFIIPPGTPGPRAMGTKIKKHGLRASHTADVFLDDCRVPGRACSAARRSSTSASRAPARARAASGRRRCRRSRRRRPTVGAQAHRHRPRRLRVRARLRQGARAVRPPDHREPGDRVRARRHADGDRRRPPARLAGVLDGPDRPPVRPPPRAR